MWFSRALVSIATIREARRLLPHLAQLIPLPHLRRQLLQPRLPLQLPQVRQAQVLKFGLFAALGAVIGSLARLQISYWMQTPSDTAFPWSTFLVNITGALLIGLVASSPNIMSNETRRHFVVTGVLGGFTTFSAIAVETLNLATTPVVSVTYVVATFAVGVLATHIGSLIGNRR